MCWKELLGCGTMLAQPTDALAQADEARQLAEATALGQISSAYYDTWDAQISDNAGQAAIVKQPWDVQRFDATQVQWVGGDNWTDNPVAVVQRQVNGKWTDFTDSHGFGGEVQTFIDKPADMLSSLPTYRSGGEKWTWRASFEVFDSYPRADVAGGQIPDGTYRFVIDGKIHSGGAATPYHLESSPFTVSRWTGIKVKDLRRDSDSTVSFAVDPIAYPVMPKADHRPGIDEMYKDDRAGNTFCHSCTFRPWATTGSVASAVVVVTGKNGSHPRTFTASYDAASGRWVANVPKKKGQTVTVQAGGVRDFYGEANGDGTSFSE